MGARFDLVIRGGHVIDGSGASPYEADVAISQGCIADIGRNLARGTEEIDAKGLMVTPGFVDPHTHYDAQVTWESRLVPSSAHGITTAIMGNDGLGFAPCRPDNRDYLVRLAEGIALVPRAVLDEGLPWVWETFPEYLDYLSTRRYDMDVGAIVPHGPLRVYAMGQQAIDLAPATDEDVTCMGAHLREAIAAGALGISTSQAPGQRSSDGKLSPTSAATDRELIGLAAALKAQNTGIFQYVGDVTSDSFELLRQLAEQSGRPVTFATAVPNNPPSIVPHLLERVAQANDAGLVIRAQTLPHSFGLLLGYQVRMNPFGWTETYLSLSNLPQQQKIEQLRRAEVRARILEEALARAVPEAVRFLYRFDKMFALGDPPDYEQPPEANIASRATRLGTTPEALAYDLMLESDGTALLYLPSFNFPNGNLDQLQTILQHRDVLPALGDGGTNYNTHCDGSYSTFFLTHFVRDRKGGGAIALPTAVHKLTRLAAEMVGLLDRGLLAIGYKADVNVIDFDRLALHAPRVINDLPGGAGRLQQRAEGYCATIVSGVPVYRNGEATGALPGKLVRGSRAAPASLD